MTIKTDKPEKESKNTKPKTKFRCGYVAVLGRSNAGKSSLINFLVGEEVAVVSHRKQTTRDQILGILTEKNFQMIFVDTPGVHHSKNNLDKYMNKNVRNAVGMADAVLYLFDGSKVLDEEEMAYIDTLCGKCENIILVETKEDKIKANEKFKKIAEKNAFLLKQFSKKLISVSVVTGQNISELKQEVTSLLPVGEAIFDKDEYTNKSVKFLISEKVRGFLLDMFDEEIPHGIAVVVTNFEEKETVKIDIEIICERDQHKGIVIGKCGLNIKKIGEKTRIFAEKLLQKKCVIKLFVKVDESWRDKNVGKYYF